MLQGIMQTIFSILGQSDYESWMEMFGKEGDTYTLVLMTGCVLICLTVSFVFKFLLKLVDR